MVKCSRRLKNQRTSENEHTCRERKRETGGRRGRSLDLLPASLCPQHFFTFSQDFFPCFTFRSRLGEHVQSVRRGGVANKTPTRGSCSLRPPSFMVCIPFRHKNIYNIQLWWCMCSHLQEDKSTNHRAQKCVYVLSSMLWIKTRR